MDKREVIGIRDLSFELTTVGDLVRRGVLERPIDGNHGEIHPKSSDFVTEGVPFVMASDLKYGRVDYQNCAFITERQADSLRKGFAKNGDVLLTHKATIGETAIVDYDKHPYIMLTPQVTYYRVKDRKALNNRYLKAYFDSSLFQQTLHMLAGSGSTRAYLGITEQHRLPIILPPPDKQKKIAAILATLDDLIANNQRRIALLESMAEEIYREWFVRMRFPGARQAASVGGVPKGWHSGMLKEIASECGKSTRPGRHLEGRKYCPLDVLATRQMIPETHYGWEEAQSSLVTFNKGDFLFGAMRPYQHKVSLAPFDGITRTTTFVIRPMQPEFYSYLFLTLFQTFSVEYATLICNGADRPYAVWNRGFEKLPIWIPDRELAGRFEVLVRPILDALMKQYFVVRRLATQRDALLPRLISGKLRVDQLDIQYPPSMMTELAQAD